MLFDNHKVAKADNLCFHAHGESERGIVVGPVGLEPTTKGFMDS